MGTAAAALRDSARKVIAQNPSDMGWHRIESTSCGGGHSPAPGSRHLVLWRRRRDWRDWHDKKYRTLTDKEDPPLWVAEQVSTGVCVTEFWAQRIRIMRESRVVMESMGCPWTVGEGRVRAGLLVTLSCANGRWVWECTGEPATCCGGLLARWKD